MTTLHNRPDTALLVIDVQTGVVAGTPRHDEVLADAHTTEDHTAYGAPAPELVIAHTNLYWSCHEAPGRRAGTVATADIEFTTPDRKPR